jgi:UTP--glucose-1-phosphate uridylyltransferase
VIELDPNHFKLLGEFEQRFPFGPPSLVDCDRLTVVGDVTFGADVTVRGSVTVEAAGGADSVPAGTVLEG